MTDTGQRWNTALGAGDAAGSEPAPVVQRITFRDPVPGGAANPPRLVEPRCRNGLQSATPRTVASVQDKRRWSLQGLLAVMALVALWPACAPRAFDLWQANALIDDPDELRRTWERAEVRIPARLLGTDVPPVFGVLGADYVQDRLDALPRDARLPLVVFLHGCNGIGLVEQKVGRLLDKAGFAVILSNSFARRLRRANCNNLKYTAGMFPPAYLYRRAELIYAIERVRLLHWVDQDRVVLGGFSEGAVAIALWGSEVDVRAYIIAGWTCTAPAPYEWLTGLRTPAARPVLTIVSRSDRWFNWPGWRGDCGAMAPDRDNVRSMVIEGSVHNVFVYPEAETALLDFLRGPAMR